MYYYICGCDVAHYCNSFFVNSALPCVVSVSYSMSRKTILQGGGNPRNRLHTVGRAFPSTPFLCSTRSHWSSLFIGDVVPSSALARVPTCFLTEMVRQVEATDRHNRRGGITRTRDKEHTHAQCCKMQPTFPSGVHYKQPDDTTMYSVQCPSAARLI